MCAASLRRNQCPGSSERPGHVAVRIPTLWSAVLTLVAASLTLRVGVFSTRLTGGFRLVAVEFVVERLQRDAEFNGSFGFVALMFVQHAIDHVHFDLAQCLRV